jgi:hypothetical protein
MLEMPLFFKCLFFLVFKKKEHAASCGPKQALTALFFFGVFSGGAQAPVRLSEDLQALLGADSLPRTGTPLSLRACGFICT